MTDAPFESARLKVVRAYGHMKALNREVDTALDRQPNAVVAQIEPDSGDKVYSADMRWQPPPEWGLLLGDFVHNLRSALDHMVWDLVLLNPDSADPDRHTEFPIYWDPAQYGLPHEAARKLRGIVPQAVDLIEEVQPYHAPNPKRSPLWGLRELDIADKHRTLLLTGSIASLRSFGHWGDLAEPVTYAGVAFEDQEEVFRIPARTHAQQSIHPTFTCDIALDVRGPYGGLAIRQASVLLYGVVSRHLHYVANKIHGLSPGNSRFYPHVTDPDPVAVQPPKCRMVER
jgi:hypothetical protein